MLYGGFDLIRKFNLDKIKSISINVCLKGLNTIVYILRYT